MKVAISIPDKVFEAAERVSKNLKIPRSQLYARAVEDFVNRQGLGDITERLNAVYSDESSELDPVIEAMSLEILRRETW